MGTIKQAFSGIQRWQMWTLVIVALIAAIGTYGSYQYLNRVPGQETEGELQLVPVQRGDLINDVSINGSLVYSNREMLRFGQRGSVSEVLIEEGQLVNSGDTLASLDQETTANLEKDVAQARVDVRSAEDALDDAQAARRYTSLNGDTFTVNNPDSSNKTFQIGADNDINSQISFSMVNATAAGLSIDGTHLLDICLLYTSPSPRD